MTPRRLEDLRIASPCQASWNDMAGDARVRFCGQCEKNVYNLSAMTRVDAEALITEREGRVCVRFFQRSDGTVLTSDCPVGVARLRLRRRLWSALSGTTASLALVLGLVAGRARADLTIRGGKPAAKGEPKIDGRARRGGEASPSIERKLMGKPSRPPPPPEPIMGVELMGGDMPDPPPPKPAPKP